MSTTTIKRTQDELVAELTARFGEDPSAWAFICPACKHIATAADFTAALAASGRSEENASAHLGQVCIGRISGALARSDDRYKGRGCDWAAFGLFRGPEFVIMPDGHESPCFAIAPAPSEVVAR